MNDTIPPHDAAAEISIIAGMAQSDIIYHKACNALTKDHFFSKPNGEVFEKLKKENSPGDIFVLNKITEEIKYSEITDFVDITYSVRGDKEISSIIEMYNRREIIKLAQNAINASYCDFEQSSMDISSQLTIKVNSLSTGNDNTTFRIGTKLSNEFDRIERIHKGGHASFIQTGLKSIDDILVIQQHDFLLFGGRPSNGKSTFAGLVGRNVAKTGKRVLEFCLDSTTETEVSRALFSEARCSLYDFNRGLMPKRDLPKLSQAAGPLHEMEYYLDEACDATIDQIIARAHTLKAEKGFLDLIIIDFIQNIRCSGYRTERERINYISSVLHNFPRKIGCPVIALSQLSRYEKEEIVPPTRRLLKESGNLEQDADAILLFHWPGGYSTYSGKDMSAFRVSIAKQKNGITGYKTLNFFGNIQLISDREENHAEQTELEYGSYQTGF